MGFLEKLGFGRKEAAEGTQSGGTAETPASEADQALKQAEGVEAGGAQEKAQAYVEDMLQDQYYVDQLANLPPEAQTKAKEDLVVVATGLYRTIGSTTPMSDAEQKNNLKKE